MGRGSLVRVGRVGLGLELTPTCGVARSEAGPASSAREWQVGVPGQGKGQGEG